MAEDFARLELLINEAMAATSAARACASRVAGHTTQLYTCIDTAWTSLDAALTVMDGLEG